MTCTLVLEDKMVAELKAAAMQPVETGAVLIAKAVRAGDGALRLLGQKLAWVPDDAYSVRKHDELVVLSNGYVPALAEAERRGCMALWVHTHPGEYSAPVPSRKDHVVDSALAEPFRLRTGSEYYGALIVSPSKDTIAFSGRLHPAIGQPTPIDRMWCVGDTLKLTGAFDRAEKPLDGMFDRSIRAFGSGIQRALGELTIGIVGCGGTGSAVCEQLVRLGVRRLKLFDVDTLSSSNVTRVYGSSLADVGRLKVDVQKDHLTRIASDLDCKTYGSKITVEATARELVGCDIVFGCTDDNAGRLVLSRLATYFLTPVIDVGVILNSDANGTIRDITGRITTLSPGAACLICRNRVDLKRAAVELQAPEERKKLADEGYAPSLEGVEPAVVTFTTAVAAAAVNELIERMIGYGPDPRPSETLIRFHEREISTNLAYPRQGHYCSADADKLGRGMTMPFLEQTWAVA